MVINEKALLTQMKEAYKGGGCGGADDADQRFLAGNHRQGQCTR